MFTRHLFEITDEEPLAADELPLADDRGQFGDAVDSESGSADTIPEARSSRDDRRTGTLPTFLVAALGLTLSAFSLFGQRLGGSDAPIPAPQAGAHSAEPANKPAEPRRRDRDRTSDTQGGRRTRSTESPRLGIPTVGAEAASTTAAPIENSSRSTALPAPSPPVPTQGEFDPSRGP